MTEKKTLSLIHLVRGIELAQKMGTEEGTLELVATYLASPGTLRKAKTDPAVLEPLLDQAAEMDGETAQEVIAYFLERCMKHESGILAFLGAEAIPEGLKALHVAAQLQEAVPGS